MKPQELAINPADVYVRTAAGAAAMDDMSRALSVGFREMLKAIDGKRAVAQMREIFPRLDEEDIALWLQELLRMKLIDLADVPFDLPEPKAVPAHAAPGAMDAAGASADIFDVAVMAANVEQWLMKDTESFSRVRKVDLNKTIQMATLQSNQALESLHGHGYFANLLEPLPMARQPAPRKSAPPADDVKPRAAARKSLALVFESDPADAVVLAGLLNAVGYQAQMCGSRQQLLLLLNQPAVPEVIFLKLGAKDVDVFKVLEKLRMHPRLGKVAVVMMSDQPSREDIAKSILLGATGWISKPYTAEVLAGAIMGVLTFPRAG